MIFSKAKRELNWQNESQILVSIFNPFRQSIKLSLYISKTIKLVLPLINSLRQQYLQNKKMNLVINNVF